MSRLRIGRSPPRFHDKCVKEREGWVGGGGGGGGGYLNLVKYLDETEKQIVTVHYQIVRYPHKASLFDAICFVDHLLLLNSNFTF